MGAFFAIIGSDGIGDELASRASRLASDTGAAIVFQETKAWVAVSNVETEELADEAGIVLGDLYFRHGPACRYDPQSQDRELLGAILRKGTLAEQCWGSFLAIHKGEGRQNMEIHHSAFSSLTAYFVELNGVVCIASDARLLFRLTATTPRIDWNQLAQHLLVEDLSFRSTCIEGVQELRCGEVLRFHPANGWGVEAAWNPWEHAQTSRLLDDPEEACELLRRELLRCISARVDEPGCSVLDLSGGLDSSIIAAVCAKVGARTRAWTFFSERDEGDERSFARAAAQHLDIGLSEHSFDAMRVEIDRCASPHLPSPYARAFVQEIDRVAKAAEPNATAFINGGGGDAVFCHLQTSAPAADALRHSGASYLRVVNEVAKSAQCSVWLALRKSLVKATRRSRGVRLRYETDFMLADASGIVPVGELPWPDVPAGILTGKLEHVYGLYMCCRNMNGFGRTPALKGIFPLLSQPLVELCLRIPSWLWVGQGRNRVLARQVAAAWLPEAVAWRVSKGGPGQLLRDTFRINRLLMREMLMDGAMQEHRIVDRAALEGHLGADGYRLPDKTARLLRLCDFEAWASSWSSAA